MSRKSISKLPIELQVGAIKVGKETGDYGLVVESSEDAKKLDLIQKAGRIEFHVFADRKNLVDLFNKRALSKIQPISIQKACC